MGVREKYEIMEEYDHRQNIQILDSDAQLEQVNSLLTMVLAKALNYVASSPDLGKGELAAIDSISKTFTRLREDQRKDDDHRAKNESDMTREEMVKLLSEQMSLLSEEERQLVLNPAQGDEDEDY